MRDKLINVLILVLSLLMAFLVLEIALRIYKGELSIKNFLEEKNILYKAAHRAQYDPELGWIPEAGFSGKENVWGTNINITETGIRSNRSRVVIESGSPPVLVVGGSFTFGDQVSDNETWPAILESQIDRKVINAAVFGYGIDQSILRAKKLLNTYKPDTVIISTMLDHIMRTELAVKRGVGKPYFEVSANNLGLKNIPVPPPVQEEHVIGRYRKIFGYSFLIHKVMMRVSPENWLEGKLPDIHAHFDGEKLSCLLVKELYKETLRNNVNNLYVLVQYHSEYTRHEVPLKKRLAILNRFINCIDQNGITVVNLWPALMEIKAQNENEYKSFYAGHMTYEGNKFVAAQIKRVLQ